MNYNITIEEINTINTNLFCTIYLMAIYSQQSQVCYVIQY